MDWNLNIEQHQWRLHHTFQKCKYIGMAKFVQNFALICWYYGWENIRKQKNKFCTDVFLRKSTWKEVEGSRSGNLGVIKANDRGFIFLFPKILSTYYHHLNQSFGHVLPYLYIFYFWKVCTQHAYNTCATHLRRQAVELKASFS